MEQYKPLTGFKIVELATFLAAPSCTKLLSDLGADVIKVEKESGDTFRHFGPTFKMPAQEDHNPAFDLMNGGKRSTIINMKTKEGMGAFFDLLGSADAFVTNVREGALKRLGCDYDSLKERFPKLVMARVTAYGDKGPRAAEPGYDAAAFWAASGFLLDQRMMVPGTPNYPVSSPQGMGDVFAGSLLANGILSALLAREKTGRGDYITSSIYGAAIWGLGIMILSDEEHHQYTWPKGRYDPGTTPYCCKDGRWVAYVIPQHERYFPGVIKAFGALEFLDDPRFIKVWDANKHKEIYVKRFEELAAQMTADELSARLREQDVPNTILNTYHGINEDEQAIVNGFIQEHTFPDGETCMMTLPSVRSRNAGDPRTTVGPLLAADTIDVLHELGYSDEKIEELVQSGAIGVRKG